MIWSYSLSSNENPSFKDLGSDLKIILSEKRNSKKEKDLRNAAGQLYEDKVNTENITASVRVQT